MQKIGKSLQSFQASSKKTASQKSLKMGIAPKLQVKIKKNETMKNPNPHQKHPNQSTKKTYKILQFSLGALEQVHNQGDFKSFFNRCELEQEAKK